MKTKFSYFVFFLFINFSFLVYPAYADEKSSGISATFATSSAMVIPEAPKKKKDYRVNILQLYLEKMHSPLAEYAKDFVEQADAFDLPWNLVVAISGTESTLGQQAPSHCNNFYGFGIYGDTIRCFPTVQEGIRTVSKSLREDYFNKYKAQSVEEIGRIYASSPMWSSHTNYFLQETDVFKQQFESQMQNQSLSISL